jgi:sulfofructose kinase
MFLCADLPPIELVDVVGVGLNATDTLIPLDNFPEPGSKVQYQSLSSARRPGSDHRCRLPDLGPAHALRGQARRRRCGAPAQGSFRRVGAEAQIVTVPGAASLHNVILIDAAGERTVICQRNEQMVLQPEDLRREWIVNARVLHVDGHDTAAATQAASWARAAGIPVVADLDDTYPGIEELVANIDYLIVSEDFSCR